MDGFFPQTRGDSSNLQPDLTAATEIGEDVAGRHRYEFIGAAPFPRPDIGGK